MLQVGERSHRSGPRPHRGSLALRDLELESQMEPLACPSEGAAPLQRGRWFSRPSSLAGIRSSAAAPALSPRHGFPGAGGEGCRDTSERTTVVTLGVQTGRVGTQGRGGNRNMGR